MLSASRGTQVTAGEAEEVKGQLASLDRLVSCLLLERTVERNQLLVQLATARLDRQLQNSKEEKGEKLAKPEDLVRLYDTLLQVCTFCTFFTLLTFFSDL